MADNANITTNADKVYKQFQQLTTKEMKSAIKKGITKGSNVVRRQARTNLRQRVGAAATNTSRYGDRLIDCVRLTKIRESKAGEFFRYLLITSTKKIRSISFLLRFFEAGTQIRRTNKGWGRGAMRPTRFFSDALTSTQSEYFATVDREITQQVDKINKKNINK